VRSISTAVIFIAVVASAIAAGPQKITIDPAAGFILGTGSTHSVIVSGYYPDGSVRDLTRAAVYKFSDPGIVTQVEPGSF